MLEFVDEHGNEVLNLGSFTLLPQHVVRLILARDELQADEFTKFQAALMWGKYIRKIILNKYFFMIRRAISPSQSENLQVCNSLQYKRQNIQGIINRTLSLFPRNTTENQLLPKP